MSTNLFKRLLRDDRASTAIEYGLIVSLVVIAIIGALEATGNENGGMWSWVNNGVLDAMDQDGE